MSARLRALVVDDHRLLAQSLAVALQQEGLDCRAPDVSGTDSIARLLADIAAHPPDVVLLDLDLGGGRDGAQLVAPMVAAGARVLVVSASTDPSRLTVALEAGAAGVLAKTEPMEVLIAAATAAAHGRPVTPDSRRRELADVARERRQRRSETLAPFARLTDREGQVLRALAGGTAVASIATSWHVAEATVRSQVRGVLTKLGVGSQLEAVAMAHESGWLSPPDSPVRDAHEPRT